MALDLPAHFRDRALRGLPKDLRERKGGHGLNKRRPAGGENEPAEELSPTLADHLIKEELGRAWQDQARKPVDEKKAQAER
jgi:hypothetical protein